MASKSGDVRTLEKGDVYGIKNSEHGGKPQAGLSKGRWTTHSKMLQEGFGGRAFDDVFKELRLAADENPVRPLFEGKWD